MERKFIPIITIPKSGTNFVNQIMQHTFGIYYTYKLFISRYKELPAFLSRLETPTSEIDDPQAHYWCGCTTHSPFNKELANVLKQHPDRIRPFFVIRDPRDVVVSYIKGAHLGLFPSSFVDAMKKRDVPLKEQYRLYMEGGNYIDSSGRKAIIGPLIHNINERIEWASQPTILVLKYEHLISSYNGGVLYKQGKMMDDIAEHLEVDTFRVFTAVFNSYTHTTRSLRKGISGSWHQEFDSDLKDIAYREFKEFIDRFDYEKK